MNIPYNFLNVSKETPLSIVKTAVFSDGKNLFYTYPEIKTGEISAIKHQLAKLWACDVEVISMNMRDGQFTYCNLIKVTPNVIWNMVSIPAWTAGNELKIEIEFFVEMHKLAIGQYLVSYS